MSVFAPGSIEWIRSDRALICAGASAQWFALSRGALTITQGALYPALYRLEEQDLLASEWGTSENNRRAKYYRLTKAGERRLRQETEDWNRLANGVGLVLDARPERA